jgi:Pectate lyase superfamily protein
VDVRDYGAKGDGTTDDTAAFEAADTAAAGRTVIVSPGTFRIAGNLTLDNPVRFEGKVTMPAASRLICRRNFDLESYTAAFGSEATGFRKALQALFFSADHAELNLNGRRVDLTGPIDVASVVGLDTFEIRRVLKNGTLNAVADTDWSNTTVTSVATYAVGQPTRLTGVANVANIVVGAHVTGTGVGREVYVKSKNVGAGTVELSQALWAAAGTRTFTFRRYKYLLDFSGFTKFSKFEITNVELQCNGECSGILLPPDGLTFRVADCSITKPKDRGITSHGRGCQDLTVDQCLFASNEQDIPAQTRTTIAFNINANDGKIRNNRASRFGTFGVMAGTGHILAGNHFFGGDDENNGTRKAGIVFTTPNLKTFLTGNYIDNSYIEWSNEHDAAPDYDAEYSFGGLTITGNIFTCNDVGAWFRWIIVAPKGPGHFINGFSVTGNAFRTINGTIDRVEKVDTTTAGLDFGRMRNVVFENNTFNGVDQLTASPVTVEHVQNTAADTWVVNAGDFMPFGARVRCVPAVVPEGAITNNGNTAQYLAPYALVEQGAGGRFAHLRWPSNVKGRAQVTVRCDTPV